MDAKRSMSQKRADSYSPRRNAISSKQSHLPLQGKSFFLHIPGYKKTLELEENIKSLGGVVEKFLSKEVKCVITNQRNQENKSSRKLTHDKRPKIKTRAQTMVERARNSNTNGGGTNILEKARTWGLQIKQLNQVVKWIATHLSKQLSSGASPGPSTSRATATVRVRKLKGDFLKVEDHSRQYRPLVKEIIAWPVLELDGSLGSSPFDGPVATRTRARLSSRSSQFPRQQSQQEKNKMNAPMNKTKRGYCEACDANYPSLSEHLNGSRHKMFAAKKRNYENLDKLIARGKSLEEYVTETKQSATVPSDGACVVGKSQFLNNTEKSQFSKSEPSKNHGKKRQSKRSGGHIKTKPRASSRRTSPNGTATSSGTSMTSSTLSSSTPSTASKASSRGSSSKKITPVKMVRSRRHSTLKVAKNKRKPAAKKAEMSPSRRTKRRKTSKTYKVVHASSTRIKLRRNRR